MDAGQSIWLVVCREDASEFVDCPWCSNQVSHPCEWIVAAYIAEDVAWQHARLAQEEARMDAAAFEEWLRLPGPPNGPPPSHPGVWDCGSRDHGCTYHVIESRLWLHPDQCQDHRAKTTSQAAT